MLDNSIESMPRSLNQESEKEEKLKELRRKLSNAKRRAKYWAGLPSFTKGAGHSMSRQSLQRRAALGTDHEIEYETAMSDVESLAEEIKKITGSSPSVIDCKYSHKKSNISS
jgi:hypothetical protein